MMKMLRIFLVSGLFALAVAGCTAQIKQSSAQSALAAGRLDEAAYDIQDALAHDPDNPQLKNLAADIFTRRGVQYYQSGTMIAAADDFRRAVGYVPTYAMAWNYLGMIASQQHDWQHAIDYGNKAASLQGKPDPAYVIDARKQLLKVQSGGIRPYLPAGKRPKTDY
ncbi:MAG TPA: tetratricopeptide repeat protein [Candidatus Binataceae bacterium]|nr:tetratricopeptide repeat protein [Candidatus Binataceae bacterium]